VAQVSERVAAPKPRTSFFGRERERAHLSELLRRSPLVTVTGPGGIGKTRLASELVATEAEPASVRWCALTTIDEDGAVAAAVADALGRGGASSGPQHAVVEAMAEREPLLILDNCEHVVAGVADLVEAILDTCPDARVLATSREPLGVEGEATLALDPLALPGDDTLAGLADSEAVDLFLDRARLVSWSFALDESNAAAVARICRRLDGLPLALELAAARMRSLGPSEISERLDGRFALLRRPRARGSERHRTLRAAIDWSYELLDEPERLVFDRLSVMAGPVDLDAAAAVCSGDGVEAGEVLDLLDRLVERSLVKAEEEAGVTRFSMLESLRHYGRERLAERGDHDARRAVHAKYVAGMADVFTRSTIEGWWGDMVRDGEAIFPEARAAALFSMRIEPDRERTLRMLAPLWALAHSRHAIEILELCDEALVTWPIEHDALGQSLLGTAAVAGFVAGTPGSAFERARVAVEAEAGGAPPAVIARRAIALVTYGFLGEVEAGIERLDEVIAAAEAEGVRTVELEMRVLRGQALAAAGRTDEALEEALAARADAERMDSPYMYAWSVYILGTVLAARGDEDGAGRAFEEALRGARRGGYHLSTGLSQRQLGMHALRGGRDAEAAQHLLVAYGHFSDSGDASQLWDVLRSAAMLMVRSGHPERAAQIIVGAEADPRARRPAPLEAGDLAALREELAAEVAGAETAPERLDELGPAVRDELAALAAERGDAEREPAAPDAGFRPEGELWRLTYDGEEVHMPNLKGLHDLARLLAQPGVELHCLELAGAAAAPAGGAAVDGLGLQGDAGELLDEQGRAEYRQRMRELREDAERAEAAGDDAAAERAREELDELTEALAAAFGLGGRPRRSGDPAERARSTVTWRIRSAVTKVEAAHPALGAHLRNSVSTGTFCVYRPERAVDWLTD
jgi:non-specific serine/threonine protein kinase